MSKARQAKQGNQTKAQVHTREYNKKSNQSTRHQTTDQVQLDSPRRAFMFTGTADHTYSTRLSPQADFRGVRSFVRAQLQ
jgi:hypothetical protein